MMKQACIYALCILCIYFASCQKDDDSIALNNNSTGNIGMVYSDTFSATLSTVYLNPIKTSSASQLCIGGYAKNLFGTVRSESCFQLSVGETGNEENVLGNANEPVYDSAVLILHQTYSYGDTSSARDLKAYRLSQDLILDNTGALYNDSECEHYQTPISIGGYYNSDLNEFHMPIEYTTGNELFNLASTNATQLQSNDAFKDYFKGIKLKSGAAVTAVYGYSLKPVLRLYYHDRETPQFSYTYDFVHKSASGDLYFNKFSNDPIAAAFTSLDENYEQLTSINTSDRTVLLYGYGYFPKINFPSLDNLKNAHPNAIIINRAELWIYPEKGTYDDLFYLPNSIGLHRIEENNITGDPIYHTGTTTQEIGYPEENQIEQKYYRFEVTDFISDRVTKEANIGTGLLICPAVDESRSKLEHMILHNTVNNINLKIYYTIIK